MRADQLNEQFQPVYVGLLFRLKGVLLGIRCELKPWPTMQTMGRFITPPATVGSNALDTITRETGFGSLDRQSPSCDREVIRDSVARPPEFARSAHRLGVRVGRPRHIHVGTGDIGR